MTRAALALLLLPLPAHAAGNAPGPMTDLLPPEWRVSVFETTCTALRDCCGVHRNCGGYATGPLPVEPAHVPLPWAGLMLTSAIAALTLKGMRG